MTEAEIAEVERRVNDEIRANHGGDVRNMGCRRRSTSARWRCLAKNTASTCACCASARLHRAVRRHPRGPYRRHRPVQDRVRRRCVRRRTPYRGRDRAARAGSRGRGRAPPARSGGLAGWHHGRWSTSARLLDRQKKLERELESLKAKAASGATGDLARAGCDVDGVGCWRSRLEGFDAKALRDAVDRLKQQLVDAVIVLAGADDGKAALVAGVSGAALGKVKAGDLLGDVARLDRQGRWPPRSGAGWRRRRPGA